MPRPSRALLGTIAAAALVLTACAPAPTSPPPSAPPPTEVAASASLATCSAPSPAQSAAEGPLTPWEWTKADLQGAPPRGQIDNLWTLPCAAVASWTAIGDDESGTSIILVSPDGLHWERAPFSESSFLVEHGTVIDGELTLVGNIGPVEAPRRQLWTTRDGSVWTQLQGVDGLGFGPGRVQQLVHGDAGWLANGVERINAEAFQGHLLQSTDRVTWKELSEPPGGLGGIASDGKRTIAEGRTFADVFPFPYHVAWSDDAQTWTAAQVATFEQFETGGVLGATPRGFAIGGQHFEQEDESSHAIGWWSMDAETWQQSTFQVLDGPAGAAAPRVMIGTADGLIASGNGDPLENAIWVSDDGRAWRQVTPLPDGDVTAFALQGDAVLLAIRPGSGGGLIWRGEATP